MIGSRLFVPGFWVVLAKIGMRFNTKLFGEIFEGKVHPVGAYLRQGDVFRSLERKLSAYHIQDMALLCSTPPAWEQEFIHQMDRVSYEGNLYAARYGCMTGIQAGPCAVGVAFMEKEQE